MPIKHRLSGFTLLELLISLSLGLFVIMIATKLLSDATRTQSFHIQSQSLYQNIQKTDEILRNILPNASNYVDCPQQLNQSNWLNLKLGEGMNNEELTYLYHPIWGGEFVDPLHFTDHLTTANQNQFSPSAPAGIYDPQWLSGSDFLVISQLKRIPTSNFGHTPLSFSLERALDPSIGSNSGSLLITDCQQAYFVSFTKKGTAISEFFLKQNDMNALHNAGFNFDHAKIYWLQKFEINIKLHNQVSTLRIQQGNSHRILNIPDTQFLQINYYLSSSNLWENAAKVEQRLAWKDVSAISISWVTNNDQYGQKNYSYDLASPFANILTEETITITNTSKYYLRTGSIINIQRFPD